MSDDDYDKPVKRLLFFFDMEAESVLLLVSFFMLYICIGYFYNWIAFFCLKMIIPFVIAWVFHVVGGFLLFFGVLRRSRSLVGTFPWMMTIVLFALTVYIVMVYIDQECIADNSKWIATGNTTYAVITFSQYALVGYLSGFNFVITLYAILLVSDYLADEDDDE